MRTPRNLKGEAAEFWKRNSPILTKAGLLTEADRDGFHLLCQCWGKLQEADEAGLDAIKFVALSKQVQNLLKAFGLTPEARRRMKIELQPQEADEFGI